MAKSFTILKMKPGASETILDTMSHYEAKNRFSGEPINKGEQVVLRSHFGGETKVLRVRDNGYCA